MPTHIKTDKILKLLTNTVPANYQKYVDMVIKQEKETTEWIKNMTQDWEITTSTPPAPYLHHQYYSTQCIR